MKMLGIGLVAVGVVRESRKFSGHPCIESIARSSLRQHSFLVLNVSVSRPIPSLQRLGLISVSRLCRLGLGLGIIRLIYNPAK